MGERFAYFIKTRDQACLATLVDLEVNLRTVRGCNQLIWQVDCELCVAAPGQ